MAERQKNAKRKFSYLHLQHSFPAVPLKIRAITVTRTERMINCQR